MPKFNFENVGDKDDAIVREVLDILVYRLPEQVDAYASDLHHELFNMDYSFIYYNSAEKACEEVGVFWAMGLIKDYEQGNFGKVYTDISDACKVANMLVYLFGEVVLRKSPHLNTVWDKKLTARDLVIIRRELQEFFDRLNGKDLAYVVEEELV